MEAIDHPSVDAAERFERAFTFAVEWHRGQPRKGSNAPYISHLMAVSALVLEDGGDLDQAAAALLHDAVEDAGGLPRLAQIEESPRSSTAAPTPTLSQSPHGPSASSATSGGSVKRPTRASSASARPTSCTTYGRSSGT